MADKAPKKYRSKFFRVAVEGATTDGRTIERAWLEQAAAAYNPGTYGARVWIEHMRSLLPDSPFRAYGDVTALKAEEVEIDGKKKMALFAQIEPTNDLVNIVNKLKQKLYTSIEVVEKFADTGKAYITGLAVTDSPASLGTDMLAFAASHPDANPLKARKSQPDALFTVADEAAIEFEEVDDKPSPVAELFAKVKALLAGKASQTDADFSAVGESLEAIASHVGQQSEDFAAAKAALSEAQGAIAKLQQDFTALTTQLSRQPDPQQPARPAATGGNGAVQTDF